MRLIPPSCVRALFSSAASWLAFPLEFPEESTGANWEAVMAGLTARVEAASWRRAIVSEQRRAGGGAGIGRYGAGFENLVDGIGQRGRRTG